MAQIVLRGVKGSSLTFAEGDANFTNLNNDKLEDITNESIGDLSDVDITGIGQGDSLVWDSANSKFVAGAGGGGGIASVSEDTSPQLGGDLDVAAFSIVSTNNNNIQITPDGSGKISLDGVRWPKVSTGGGGGEVQGTVTAIDDQRSPNTITLSNFDGISVGDAIVFTGTQVSSAGLVENEEYEIASDLGAGEFEIADPIDNNPALLQLTDVAPYTDFNYTVTTSGGGSSLAGGEVLTYNTDGDLTWTQPDSGGATQLIDLTDVDVTAPDNGDVLTFNSSASQWEAQSLPASGASALTELNDTNITAPANNNVLRYDGTNWVNTAQANLAAGSANSVAQNTTTQNADFYPLLSSGASSGIRTPFFSTSIRMNPGTNLLTLNVSGSGISIRGPEANFSEGALTTIKTNAVTNYTLTLPANAGSNGQALITNGSGVTSWGTPAISQLTTNLNVAGNSIVSVSNGNITLAPNGTGKTITNRLNYNEAVHSLGTTSGTIAPNATNGNVQTITLNGNLTLNAFTNPVAGQSITLIVNTGGTGRTLTSTMKFAGGEKTLSDTNTTDIISIFYDGTNYWASLSKDFY